MIFPEWPTGTPSIVIIIGTILFGLLLLIERLAKVAGPLGALRRWFETRAIREIERKSELDDSIEAMVQKRVEWETRPMKASMAWLETQVRQLTDKLEQREEQHRKEIAFLVDYITKVTAWWHRLKIWLAAQGIEIREEMPEFKDYSPSSDRPGGLS